MRKRRKGTFGFRRDEMLEKAIAWRDKLTKIVPLANDPNYIIEKIEILDYLIEKAKESEIPIRAEISE